MLWTFEKTVPRKNPPSVFFGKIRPTKNCQKRWDKKSKDYTLGKVKEYLMWAEEKGYFEWNDTRRGRSIKSIKLVDCTGMFNKKEEDDPTT